MGLQVVSRLFDDAGRLRGSYVYILLCMDADGPIYAKVGVADNPHNRINALMTSSPVPARHLAYVHVNSRRAALKMEKDFLDTLKHWRSNGEWFRFSFDDKPIFNRFCREIFGRHATKSWPLQWSKIPLRGVKQAAKIRRTMYRKMAMKRGQAFRDAMADFSLG